MLPNKRLLFVDDEPNMLTMLARLLESCGMDWEGEYCLGVDEAMAALRSRNFDTVVTDVRMPVKDGFALISEMQADAGLCNIPVIFLTGESDIELKRKALQMGAVDLLSKPIHREDLLARLRSALRLKEYQDKLEKQVSALDLQVFERTRELEDSRIEVLWRLAKAGEFRDDETGDHVARVAWCSCLLAEGIGMPAKFIELLFETSPLHDLGKIGISDTILLKEGRLTPEERANIQQHAEIGERILNDAPRLADLIPHMNIQAPLNLHTGSPSPMLKTAATIARHHHEKWDGTGYPDGLAGERIPIEARIVALADVYDALRSRRPYKAAMTKSHAQAIVRDECGRHFDPRVVEAFFQLDAKISVIYGDRAALIGAPPGVEGAV